VRLGVLSDIHGNLRALEAVQRDLRWHSPDLVVNLGDHLSGPLQAAATADALMSAGYVGIRGNHDRQLLDRPVEKMGLSDRAASSQLTQDHRDWLQALPATLDIEPGIHLCHGSPGDDLQYLLEDVRPDGVHMASAQTIRARLGEIDGKLILCGHSHVPRLVTIAGNAQIVNPGSVGVPAYTDVHPCLHYMETGSPHARYALLDREGATWRVTFIAVEYDWHAASEEAQRNNRPDWAHALATGYALRSA
jgi:predicted phosphodiesterase